MLIIGLRRRHRSAFLRTRLAAIALPQNLACAASLFSKLAIMRIFLKFATHSRRICAKSTACREPRLQGSLLGCGQQRRVNSRNDEGSVMRFLLRLAFWLSIVVLLLPAAPSKPTAGHPPIGASDAVSAATAAVSDMRQFCLRQPDACAVGSQAISQFGQKAQAGAKMLYDFLNDKVGAEQGGALGANSVEKSAPTASRRPSQDTLTPADLVPVWRAPLPRREAEAKRPT